jgi:hypothetical protein
MATNDSRTPSPQPAQRPTPSPTPDLRKSTPNSGTRILGENTRETTVFQTRPTPPDPNPKK